MAEPARITVLAGVNGAGKSSIAGAALRAAGGEYFNPDEVTRRILDASPLMTPAEANARAWEEGRARLAEAIRRREDFVFETTLGGATITRLLSHALDEGLEVAMLYVGLESAEQYVARVRSRVRSGGHDIPEAKIRERVSSSMKNLVKLAKRLTVLRLLDNSAEADPKKGQSPQPRELLYAERGEVLRTCELSKVPVWAKPVFAVLLRDQR